MKDRIVVKAQELPSSFHHVRLVLARGKDHPEGDREEGESGGAKVGHGSGGIMLLRAE